MYVIDESSYRIDKTSFPTAEEAEQRAGEAARIVNRPINVYELLEGELHFAFRVLPCGDVEHDQPTVEPETGDQITQEYPVLGEIVSELDAITEVLEAKGATELAARVDRVVHKLTADRPSPGIKKLVASLHEAAGAPPVQRGKYSQAAIVLVPKKLAPPSGETQVYLSKDPPGREGWWQYTKPAKTFKGANKVTEAAARQWVLKQGITSSGTENVAHIFTYQMDDYGRWTSYS